MLQIDIADRIATVTLDREDRRNALCEEMVDQFSAALESFRGVGVRCVVLRARPGCKVWSAGHDINELPEAGHDPLAWRDPLRKLIREIESFPAPIIAMIEGSVWGGACETVFACDLIIAADNAQFSDPVLAMGICGVELHAHTWEFGPRKAKELLFTGDAITAEQAERLGMVNHVVPLDQLVPETIALAQRIAKKDAFALRMAKRAVNQTLDIQGYTNSIDAIFDMHHFGHARAALVTGGIPSLAGLGAMKAKGKG